MHGAAVTPTPTTILAADIAERVEIVPYIVGAVCVTLIACWTVYAIKDDATRRDCVTTCLQDYQRAPSACAEVCR